MKVCALFSALGTHIPDPRQSSWQAPQPCLLLGAQLVHSTRWAGVGAPGGQPSRPASCSGTGMGLAAHGSPDGAGGSDRRLKELETSLAHSPVLMRAHPSDSPFPSRVCWGQEEGAEMVLLLPEAHNDVGPEPEPGALGGEERGGEEKGPLPSAGARLELPMAHFRCGFVLFQIPAGKHDV